MGTLIGIVLVLVGLAMIGIGIWAFRDANRPGLDPPLLFRWAQGANKTAGVIFAAVMVVAGLAVGWLGVTNLGV